ncbi:MobV family relaxase [Kaistella yonginensis]|uniref:MobV family relaxase n=1 Tax=Kaistella yonginensis TaxID=658267 RepID=UPI0025B3A96A|nr:MobV family relaxase [Kaistella yonginensis]MDN3606366.1 MobV family relaxase [Kaistella yonginensis]
MSYAVYHSEKGKVSSGGIGHHIDRAEGKEHSYKHADPERKHLNQHIEVTSLCKIPLHHAIEKRISEGYKTQKAIRKDAVKYTTHILTGSHERMKEIEAQPKELEKWISANQAFICSEFGKENIVRFVLHRDEKTPHIHAVTVNLTSDGRLSAKEIIGNRESMQTRQDRYAEAMKPFGLNRGLKSTGIKHEEAREYYGRINSALEDGNNTEGIEAKKKVMGIEIGIDKDKTIEILKEHLVSFKTSHRANAEEIKKLKKNIERTSVTNTHFEGKFKNSTIQKDNMIINRDIYEKSRENFILEKFNERILNTLNLNVRQQIEIAEEIVPSSEVSGLFLQQFQFLVRATNLKDNIKKDMLESTAVQEKLSILIGERETIQNNLIDAIKEKKFEIADLQLKLNFLDRIDKEEPISIPSINIETIHFLKNVFPDEKVLELATKYGKHECDYLEYLSQRIAQYQVWKKEGHIEEVKANARKEILRLTNPEEYDLQHREEEKKKGKGFSR